MDIQVGDRITYKYKDENNILINIMTSNVDKEIVLSQNVEILKIERPSYEVIEEKKELLTEEEKEFIKSSLKIMNKITIVYKLAGNLYFLENKDSGWTFALTTNNKFQGLKDNINYTLKELGL